MNSYLLTGATGFLGSEIYQKIKKETLTLGRSPSSDIFFDFGSVVSDFPKVKMVIHCAGKAHSIPKTEDEKEAFFSMNTKGTSFLLESLEASMAIPETFVFISTVSVYGLEKGLGIKEESPLLGDSPYARSKILAEKMLEEWSNRTGVKLIILRLPLIAGNHPPGNLGAMINAIKKGFYFSLRNNTSKKSIVLAEDVAKLIPQIHGKCGIFNLTDRIHPSISEIEQVLSDRCNRSLKSIPFQLVNFMAKVGDQISFFPVNTNRLIKLTSSLTFDDSKAVTDLNWKPNPVLDFLKNKIEIKK